MNKFILLILLFFSIIDTTEAQTIDFSQLKNPPKSDTIAKKILETAQYVVTYDYKYANDAAYPDTKREGLTVLQVGERYNRFCDYYELQFDSLIDVTAKEKLPITQTGPMMLSVMKKEQCRESIIIDKQKDKETIQRTAGLKQKYQYSEDCPKLEWELLEGDSTIAGYKCNKAKTTLFGRTYTAWYAPEVNMPYGPYKFNGLPGLIFKVVDTQDNFIFTLVGLEKATTSTPIYFWTKSDIIKTSREKVRKIYKNYCADPVGALTSDGTIKVDAETRASVNSKPYNPIELE